MLPLPSLCRAVPPLCQTAPLCELWFSGYCLGTTVEKENPGHTYGQREPNDHKSNLSLPVCSFPTPNRQHSKRDLSALLDWLPRFCPVTVSASLGHLAPGSHLVGQLLFHREPPRALPPSSVVFLRLKTRNTSREKLPLSLSVAYCQQPLSQAGASIHPGIRVGLV